MTFSKMKYIPKQLFKNGDKYLKEDVEENDLSKIMFYLNIIFSCIDYNENDIDWYTNYLNYSSLSFEDIQFLFFLALHLSPDLFIGNIFFPNDQLTSDIEGKLSNIDQINQQFIVPPSLVIDGRSFKIHKIFIFKQILLNKYYLDPMNRLKQEFRS